MHDYWRTIIGRQFAAAIQMLRSAVEACPDDLWDERAYGTPFWHLEPSIGEAAAGIRRISLKESATIWAGNAPRCP